MLLERKTCQKSAKKALKFIRNPDKLCDLLLEMATLVDIVPDLILPTTLLEGDDFLIPFVTHALTKCLQIHVPARI